MMPSCSHTGTPRHFHSSTTPGQASLMRLRTRASVSPRQSPSSLIRASISRDGEVPAFAFVAALLAFVLVGAISFLEVSPSSMLHPHAYNDCPTIRTGIGLSADREVPHDESPAQETRTMPGTVRLHRVIATKPDKLYRAFVEADALAKWMPPNGFTCTVDHLDAKVGGTFRMSFRNFTTGNGHTFGGEYLELVPGERLRYTDKFDDPNLPGELQVTVILKKVSVGTELEITQ